MPHSSQKHSSEEETFPFISPKLLLTLVVGMGILIILGIAVLIGVIIHRLNTPHSPNHAVLSSFASHSCFPEAYQRHMPPPILLTLTKEEHIAHITPVGTCVLALHIIDHHNEKIFLKAISNSSPSTITAETSVFTGSKLSTAIFSAGT